MERPFLISMPIKHYFERIRADCSYKLLINQLFISFQIYGFQVSFATFSSLLSLSRPYFIFQTT